MDREPIKNYLSRYKELQLKADDKLRHIKILEEKVYSVGSSLANSDEPKVSSSGLREDRILRIIDLKKEWADEALDALEVRQEIFGLIVNVADSPGDVLIERYIHLKQWDRVSDDLSISLTQVHKSHRQGLDIVSEIMSERGIM